MGNHAYKCSYNSSQSCWTVYTGNFPPIPNTPHATEVFSLVPKILFFINWILVKQLYLWELEILNLLTGSLRSGEEESLIFSTVLCSLLISSQNGMCLPSLIDTLAGLWQGNLCQQPLYKQNLHISPWELFSKNTSFTENSFHKISWLTEVSCSQPGWADFSTITPEINGIVFGGTMSHALTISLATASLPCGCLRRKKWSESEWATVPAKRGRKKGRKNSHGVGYGKIRCWFENTEAMDWNHFKGFSLYDFFLLWLWNHKRLLIYFRAAPIIILC